MKQIKSEERVILKELFEGKKALSIYHFHKKHLISPIQIYSIIDKHIKKGFLKKRFFFWVILTRGGREWIDNNRNRIFNISEPNKYWKDIPKHMVRDDTLDINKPCLPELKYLDKKYFLSLNEKK